MDNGELIIKSANPLKEKSYSFALLVVRAATSIQVNKKEFILSKQLLRSGTSIGALIEEANQAESKADFIHKLSIANKEANESKYWIRLLKDSDIIELNHASELLSSVEELIKMLIASIKTTKLRLKS